MTAVEPLPVPEPARAIWCTTQHVVDPLILCKRLAGHPGLHASDGGDNWNSADEENER